MSDPAYTLTVRPDGDGPPPEVRLRSWLKQGLRCRGVAAVPTSSTGWWPATNCPGRWRPQAPTRRG